MAEISERSFPFDAEEVNGTYDREYTADEFAEYFRAFISSGIFMKESTNLQIVSNNDMTVTLKPGRMIIEGYRYTNKSDIIIQIDPADGVLNRIDRISVTWSKEDRDIHYMLQKGIPSYSPIAKECRRNAEYKDYVVADIYIKAGAIKITQSAITDTRLNTQVCGLAMPFVDLDTSVIYNQLQTFYEETVKETEEWQGDKKASFEAWCSQQKEQFNNWYSGNTSDWEEEFDTWFENIKDKLGGDTAGNLQNQIDELSSYSVTAENGGKSFANLINFVETTAADIDHGHMFRFKDTGGWGPAGTTDTWYRCIVQYQNAYGNESADIEGNVTIFEGQKTWTGLIAGNKKTGISVSWRRVIDEDCMLGTMEEVEANTNSGYVADALVVSSLKNNVNMLSAGLNSIKTITIDSNTINTTNGQGQYFSSGGVWVTCNDYFVQISIRLYFAISLAANSTYAFRVPASTPFTGSYHERVATSGGGKRMILALNNQNVFSFIPTEIISAGDYIREDFFCFKK